MPSIPHYLGQRRRVGRDHRGAERHGLDDWCTETFVSTRKHQRRSHSHQAIAVTVTKPAHHRDTVTNVSLANQAQQCFVRAPLPASKHQMHIKIAQWPRDELNQKRMIFVRMRDCRVHQHVFGT